MPRKADTKTSIYAAIYIARRPLVSRRVHCFAARVTRYGGDIISAEVGCTGAVEEICAMTPDEAVALSFAFLSDLRRSGLTGSAARRRSQSGSNLHDR